jgi:hypothetical protein
MAELNCLSGCIANYICGRVDLPGPAGEQAESFAPWCWIKFGEGDQITVGNESYSGDPNTACVKSMEIGWTDTPSMKCEIVDEKGGTLGVVVDALRKCLKNKTTKAAGKGTSAYFQFGWIMTTCEGGRNSSHVIPSDTFELIIKKLDVSYSEGKIKYTIEGTALDKLEEVSRSDKTIGEDSKPIDIESAIRTLCAEDPQINVRFAEITPDGRLKDTKFEWARVKDVKASWQADNQNRISTITKWLAPFRIKDGQCDKGVVLYFDPTKSDELIILKDPSPNPGDTKTCGAQGNDKNGPLGTFIVNGGKCSSVIEFSPNVDIVGAIASMAVGGDTSGPNKSSNQLAEDKRCQNQKAQGVEAGTQIQATITQQAFDSYGTRSANDEALRSEIAHNKASLLTSTVSSGIEAQLKILGNPTNAFCGLPAARNLSIVVINPFHLRNMRGCGDWLAQPGCNQIFTNRLWMLKGINHSISPGSYTTTLNVFLAGEGIHVSGSEPMGGNGGGGPTTKNNCD